MGKQILLTLITILFSCSETNNFDEQLNHKFIIPQIYIGINTNTPFTGILNAYPCKTDTSIYFGNYNKGKRTSINALYTISNGDILQTNNPIFLPIGNYNIVYWGIIKSTQQHYSNNAITAPKFTIGTDLAQQHWKLRKYASKYDTTHYPVYDYAYAVQNMQIGSKKNYTYLTRVVASLDVILKNKNNTPFNNIAEANVTINGIAEKLNIYTAKPSNQYKTVKFPLTLSEDKTQIRNQTVMLFPSAPQPTVQIFITLTNGSVKTYKLHLNKALIANNKTTLTLILDEIFTTKTQSGTLSVETYSETREPIITDETLN